MFLTIFTGAMITLIGKKIITTCGTINWALFIVNHYCNNN